VKPTVSIVICSRDRSGDLFRTLQAMARLQVPFGWDVELLVVDNGSREDTPAVIGGAFLPRIELRHLREPRPGVCHARNTALAAAQGEIVLLTDDDLSPAPDWLIELASPLLSGRGDAAVGQIDLAPHLQRSWMTDLHKRWLATPDAPLRRGTELIGANMGFHRSMLELVPGFDPELGPGALGFGDDTLFSWQLQEAGARLLEVPGARNVHHPDPARLQRRQWLRAAVARGRTLAYLSHHWLHHTVTAPRAIAAYYLAKLMARRSLDRPMRDDAEGCPRWEISFLSRIAKYRQFATERRRTRNYTRRGLKKLDSHFPQRPASVAAIGGPNTAVNA
jgi:glycosyltransferase involved in cell wall biosynthesis